MRSLALKFVLVFLLGTALVADNRAVSPLPKPNVTINLAKLGWRDPPMESDKSLVRNFFSDEKLEAGDFADHIVFLNDDVFVVFHAMQESQEGKDWRTVRRELEAYFFRTKDGTLLLKQRWLTSPRKDQRDRWESEARLIRISDDRFLIHANGTLMLYTTDLRLLKESKLDPAGWNDVWGAQSIPGGRYILLRRGARSGMYGRYAWLDSDTLETKYQIESYSLWKPVGTEDSLVGGSYSGSGIQRVDLNQRATVICPDQSCSQAGEFDMLSSHKVVFLYETGVGVIDVDHGLLWSDHIDSKKYVPQFLHLKSAVSGRRFAFFIIAAKKTSFHGEKIGGWATIFVYDAESQIPMYALHTHGVSDYAFSPDGSKFAVLDRTGLRVYTIN